jgi:hypothetical protein
MDFGVFIAVASFQANYLNSSCVMRFQQKQKPLPGETWQLIGAVAGVADPSHTQGMMQG